MADNGETKCEKCERLSLALQVAEGCYAKEVEHSAALSETIERQAKEIEARKARNAKVVAARNEAIAARDESLAKEKEIRAKLATIVAELKKKGGAE